MPNNEFYGRRVAVGVGVESTYGTAVAPSAWPRHMKLSFQRKNTIIQNTSAMGRNETVNDSAVTETWAEGDLEGKVYDQSIGYLLYNMFGSLSTATNSDASGTVKDHTFDVSQSGIAKTLTIARVDPLSSRRHAMATIEQLEFTIEQGGWVMVSASIQAQQGTTSADTAAYVTENSFTSKHAFAKIAANAAGLSGASNLDVKSMKLTLKREVSKYFPFGSTDPSAINVGAWSAEGEMTFRYTDTTLETTWFSHAIQALQLGMKNTDVTIGTSANPGLVFTMPKVRLNTFDMSDDLDNIVEQTVGFTCELDTTAGYMIRAVLTDTKASF